MLSQTEQSQVAAANASGKPTVIFVHGLWVLASSWDNWRELFEKDGYATIAAQWPSEPANVAEARAHPDKLAGTSIKEIADHVDELARAVTRKPAIVGHSIGGLVAQNVAGRGTSAATVAIDPAPFRGVLPVPIAALRSAFPVLRNPLNRGRAVALTKKQFRYGWGNGVSEAESNRVYDEFHVAAPGKPVFQDALININPWTQAKVDSKHPERGPLLLIGGEADHAVPISLVTAAYGRHKRNQHPTELKKFAGRGHSLTIDAGWPEIADAALAFVRKHLAA